MAKIFLQNFCKTSVVLLSLLLSSCIRSSNESSSFRIVGLNGEKRDVKMRVPELNARILESQGRMPVQQEVAMAEPAASDQQKYASATNPNSDAMRETMQAEQARPLYNVAKETPQTPENSEQKPENISVGRVAEKEQEIQFDLSESAKDDRKSGKKMKLKVGKSSATKVEKDEEAVASQEEGKTRGIFVQTGSFANEENAKQDSIKMKKFGKVQIAEVDMADKKNYRVLIGPFPNSKKAKLTLHKVKNSGHEAIIVKNK